MANEKTDTAAAPQEQALCGARADDPSDLPIFCKRYARHEGDHSDGHLIWNEPARDRPDLEAMNRGRAAVGMSPLDTWGTGGARSSTLDGGACTVPSSTGQGGSSSAPPGGGRTLGGTAAGALDRDPVCGADCGRHGVRMVGASALCVREPGHTGAHSNGKGLDWSAAPPLGPVPERFRTMPRPPELEPFRPDATVEALLAGLVACGRSLGQIDKEIGARAHWKRVLGAGLKALDATPDSELTEDQWARLGRYLFGAVHLVADETSEHPKPIQERAEALATLILQGRRIGTPPNFLIRAGAVLEVLRQAWRKAQRGES